MRWCNYIGYYILYVLQVAIALHYDTVVEHVKMNIDKEVINLNNSEWKNSPIVFFTGILVLYTVGNSIVSLFNL
jgi:hypothetical protein